MIYILVIMEIILILSY